MDRFSERLNKPISMTVNKELIDLIKEIETYLTDHNCPELKRRLEQLHDGYRYAKKLDNHFKKFITFVMSIVISLLLGMLIIIYYIQLYY